MNIQRKTLKTLTLTLLCAMALPAQADVNIGELWNNFKQSPKAQLATLAGIAGIAWLAYVKYNTQTPAQNDTLATFLTLQDPIKTSTSNYKNPLDTLKNSQEKISFIFQATQENPHEYAQEQNKSSCDWLYKRLKNLTDFTQFFLSISDINKKRLTELQKIASKVLSQGDDSISWKNKTYDIIPSLHVALHESVRAYKKNENEKISPSVASVVKKQQEARKLLQLTTIEKRRNIVIEANKKLGKKTLRTHHSQTHAKLLRPSLQQKESEKLKKTALSIQPASTAQKITPTPAQKLVTIKKSKTDSKKKLECIEKDTKPPRASTRIALPAATILPIAIATAQDGKRNNELLSASSDFVVLPIPASDSKQEKELIDLKSNAEMHPSISLLKKVQQLSNNPTEQIQKLMHALDAIACAHQEAFEEGTYVIEDFNGEIFKFLKSHQDCYERSSSHFSELLPTRHVAGVSFGTLGYGINISLPHNMGHILFNQFEQHGKKYIFIKPEEWGTSGADILDGTKHAIGHTWGFIQSIYRKAANPEANDKVGMRKEHTPAHIKNAWKELVENSLLSPEEKRSAKAQGKNHGIYKMRAIIKEHGTFALNAMQDSLSSGKFPHDGVEQFNALLSQARLDDLDERKGNEVRITSKKIKAYLYSLSRRVAQAARCAYPYSW